MENLIDYKSLFHQAPLPYQESDKNCNIMTVNDAWYEMFGYTYEDVIGKKFYQFLTEESKNTILNKVPEFLIKGKINDVELSMICKDKSIIYVKIFGTISYNQSHHPLLTHCILQNVSNEKSYKSQLYKNYEETIFSFISISEQKDSYTAGHSARVAFYASKIAENIGMNFNMVNTIYKAGMLHDIGKVIIPETILLKPGKFTLIEIQLMKEHVNAGYDILKHISMYSEIADIMLYHHEKYNGTGYPSAKKGDEIPIASQILSIADTFDAMTTNRIYKARKSVKEAIYELKTLGGTWFDPILLNKALIFLDTLPEIKHINQLPKTEIEKQRFSYFFKDQLTNVFNGEYLNIILIENNINHNYDCFNYVKIRNMGKYNTEHGWEKGDQLIQAFAKELTNYVNHDNIYRIYGDDFIILNKKHFDIDLNVINQWDIIKDLCIFIDVEHYDLREIDIMSWQDLERVIA